MITAKESAHFYGIVMTMFAQSQKVERLQSEMKTQEQKMEDIDGAKTKITVSACNIYMYGYMYMYAVLWNII